MVAHDEFLREPLGDIRGDAADILADELDLLAGDRVAMLFHVELDGVVHLRGGVGELAGIRIDDPDLDGVLRIGRTDCALRQRQAGNSIQEYFAITSACTFPPVFGFFPLCSASDFTMLSRFECHPRSSRRAAQPALIVAVKWAGAREGD